MKCRTCDVEIPGPNGSSFYSSIGVDGMQCEKCAVDEYKAEKLFWNIPIMVNPRGIWSLDSASQMKTPNPAQAKPAQPQYWDWRAVSRQMNRRTHAGRTTDRPLRPTDRT